MRFAEVLSTYPSNDDPVARSTQGSESLVERVIELTKDVPAEAIAVGVGALVGVTLFVCAMIAFRSSKKKQQNSGRPLPRPSLSANEVIFMAPAPTSPQATRDRSVFPAAPSIHPANPVGPHFKPSSALSARVFAKMGMTFEQEEALQSSELCVVGGTAPMPVLDANGQRAGAPAVAAIPAAIPEPVSVPMPLASVECVFDDSPPPSSSSAETQPASVVSMRAASIVDLDIDDSPTELREPLFDDPPQKLRRMTPPKIRKVEPAAPRTPSEPPPPVQQRGMLPKTASQGPTQPPLGPLPPVTAPFRWAGSPQPLPTPQTPQTEPISRPF